MKKDRLKKHLFESAWQIVETEGIDKLNARKLAKRCNCSVGSIYTTFDNFQDLQLNLNAKILSMLYASLINAFEIGIQNEKSLREIFKGMGRAYIDFGQNNLLLWKSLFEYLPFESIPNWYVKHTREGIYNICERVSSCFGLSEDTAKQIVGFFWTSIHGISAIFLNQKMKMVSELFDPNKIDDYVEYCLDGLFKEVLDAQLVSS